MNDEPKKEEIAGALVPIDRIQETKPSEYIQQVRGLIAKKKQKEAFFLTQQAHVKYPDDPYILSYYGWLQAVADKRYRSGVETCVSAVALLNKHAAKGKNVQYGIVYANLVRANLAAGRKKDAVEAVKKGLKYDPGNKELMKELDTLGRRNKAAIPFLDRSNPINMLLGMMRNKIK